MTVEAIDSGETKLSSQATIFINILDENDNPPIFKRRKYQGFMNSDLSDFRNDLQVIFKNFIFDSTILRQQTDFAQTLNRLWTNFKQTLNKLWTNFEQTLNKLWTDFEQTLYRLWS